MNGSPIVFVSKPRHRYSQVELAKELGCSPSLIRLIEQTALEKLRRLPEIRVLARDLGLLK